jgi:Abnormal spindle-like microcephaly-assoc'd, ASPM-SPD-2-Hydin
VPRAFRHRKWTASSRRTAIFIWRSKTPPKSTHDLLRLTSQPSAAGTQNQTVAISSNDPSRPSLNIALAATGTSGSASAIDVSPASLDFGSVIVGQNKDLTLTVRNNGTAALTVNSATSSNPRFSLVNLSTPLNLAPGASQAVGVRFTPTAAGSQTGTLTISSNDLVRPAVTVNLTGTVPGTTGGGTATLSVDDGGFEQVVGITGGAPAVYLLNRLTPPSYPATLKSVQIMFLSLVNALKAGDSIRILIGTNPSGSSNINNIRLLAATTMVGVAGQFNAYDTPATTIQSGDFVVGFTSASPANVFPGALDTTPPNRQRSYASADGVSFQLLDTGNLGIRAVVDLGAAGSSVVVTPAGDSLMFEALQRYRQ